MLMPGCWGWCRRVKTWFPSAKLAKTTASFYRKPCNSSKGDILMPKLHCKAAVRLVIVPNRAWSRWKIWNGTLMAIAKGCRRFLAPARNCLAK